MNSQNEELDEYLEDYFKSENTDEGFEVYAEVRKTEPEEFVKEV